MNCQILKNVTVAIHNSFTNTNTVTKFLFKIRLFIFMFKERFYNARLKYICQILASVAN